MPRTILVVDDEPQIRRVVKHALEAEDTRILEAGTAREAIDLAAAQRPDLIILDLGLPDGSGEDVCREVRGWSKAPILVLSARGAEAEKVALLDAGADDFVTKPFGPTELQARVRALLRRHAPADGETVLEHAGLTINLVNRSVERSGSAIRLTPIEWELLKALATHAGRVMTHAQLFQAAWKGREHGDAQQYLRVHVAHLRRKIEPDPVRPLHIFTVAGVGYRFGE